MRRRSEEEPMLEMGCQGSDSLRAKAIRCVVTSAGRSDVVGLIHNQDIEGSGVRRLHWEDVPQHPHWNVELHPVDRGYQPRKMGPGVGVYTARSAELL